jgi:hypothetical protein
MLSKKNSQNNAIFTITLHLQSQLFGLFKTSLLERETSIPSLIQILANSLLLPLLDFQQPGLNIKHSNIPTFQRQNNLLVDFGRNAAKNIWLNGLILLKFDDCFVNRRQLFGCVHSYSLAGNIIIIINNNNNNNATTIMAVESSPLEDRANYH